MNRTSGLLTLALVMTALTSHGQAQDAGRWCSEVGGAHSQQYISTKSEVDAECDGGLKGSILNDTPIMEVTIRMRQDGPGGRDRYATFATHDLTAEDSDIRSEFYGSRLKGQLDEYLLQHKMKLSPDNGFLDIVAIKIPSSAKFYKDLSATEEVKPQAPSKLAKVDSSKPLAKEMACMNGLSNVPGSRNTLLGFDAGSANRQPVIVYEGLKRGDKTLDAIYTLDGVFFNEYNSKEKYSDEHYYELPGNKNFPNKQWIYTNFDEKGWSNPNIYSHDETNTRPSKKVIKTDFPLIDPNSDAMKMLDTQLLEATRRIRKEFDTNPRLGSQENLSLIAAAIDECKKVDALHPEIEYFEGHIFPTNGSGAKRPATVGATR